VTIFKGQPVPLTFPLADASGNPVNAVSGTGAVTCTVTLPDQTTATPTVTNPAVGTYTATGPSGQAGHYLVAWSCTDATYPGGLTDAYNVSGLSEVSILSLAEARRALRISASDTSEDDFIRDFNPAVTNVVEWWCGPVLVQTVVEELRAGGLTVMLSKPPVLNLLAWTSVPAEFSADTSRVVPVPPSPMFPVMIYGPTYPLAQLHVNKTRSEVRHTAGLPFYYGPYLWMYSAGRPVVPDCILDGSRAILRHLYSMERGGQGGAAIGQADEETTMTPFGFAVPNRALEMMAPEALAGAIA